VETPRPSSGPFGPTASAQFGAALAEAMAALRDSLPIDRSFRGCAKSRAGVMPSGTSLMVIVRDLAVAPLQVERVDVDSSGVRTHEGAGVGDLETAVVEMYRGRVRVEPHKYTGPRGHYLVVENPRDTLHRIVFETDGQRVLRYHAGRRPAVDLVEGCG
jgi:hypothetical protein